MNFFIQVIRIGDYIKNRSLFLEPPGKTVELTIKCQINCQEMALRFFCVSVFRSLRLREWVKQKLVKVLITGAEPWPLRNCRTVNLGQELTVVDNTTLTEGYKVLFEVRTFVPTHMASQGYWQIQDEEEVQ